VVHACKTRKKQPPPGKILKRTPSGEIVYKSAPSGEICPTNASLGLRLKKFQKNIFCF